MAYSNLMIVTLQVKVRENSSACHHIQDIIKAWNGKLILDSYLINCSTVKSHRHEPSFFGVSNTSTTQGLVFLNKPVTEEVGDLLL